jgi:UDP-glucose 4-epimerase
MRILITGGAGYIGTALTQMLYKRDEVDEIVIYDNLSRNNYNIFLHSGIPHGKVRFIRGELLDSRNLRNVVRNADVIFHLAARVSTPLANESSHLYEQVNNWGTAELVYAIEEHPVQKVIYLSSASVYGASSEAIDVSTIPDPKSFYGISKHRGEQHIARLMSKIPAYVIRSGNVYGYGTSMRFDAVINQFMFNACFSNRISIYGDGLQHRSFIHIEKAATILTELLWSELEPGYYNLVDRIMPIGEIAAVLKEMIPEMEMIFINQHMKMRELKVQRDERIMKLYRMPDLSFNEEMAIFLERFHQSKAEG